MAGWLYGLTIKPFNHPAIFNQISNFSAEAKTFP
jgi:hypothetical protein